MLPSPRLTNGLIAGLCVVAMLFAYYLDGVLGLEPCPLCMTQRVFVVGCGLFALVAFAHGPGLLGRRVYALIAGLFALGGGAVAARHVWLQHLPDELVPACGPGLSYMLETLPLSETLELILMGDGNCAEVVWTFMGLSIPEQTLILFFALTAANVWQLLRGETRTAEPANEAGLA
jgi:disulfide bond formation protein DsbB